MLPVAPRGSLTLLVGSKDFEEIWWKAHPITKSRFFWFWFPNIFYGLCARWITETLRLAVHINIYHCLCDEKKAKDELKFSFILSFPTRAPDWIGYKFEEKKTKKHHIKLCKQVERRKRKKKWSSEEAVGKSEQLWENTTDPDTEKPEQSPNTVPVMIRSNWTCDFFLFCYLKGHLAGGGASLNRLFTFSHSSPRIKVLFQTLVRSSLRAPSFGDLPFFFWVHAPLAELRSVERRRIV